MLKEIFGTSVALVVGSYVLAAKAAKESVVGQMVAEKIELVQDVASINKMQKEGIISAAEADTLLAKISPKAASEDERRARLLKML